MSDAFPLKPRRVVGTEPHQPEQTFSYHYDPCSDAVGCRALNQRPASDPPRLVCPMCGQPTVRPHRRRPGSTVSTPVDRLGHEQDDEVINRDLEEARMLLTAARLWIALEGQRADGDPDLESQIEDRKAEVLSTFAEYLRTVVRAHVDHAIEAAIHAHHRQAHR